MESSAMALDAAKAKVSKRPFRWFSAVPVFVLIAAFLLLMTCASAQLQGTERPPLKKSQPISLIRNDAGYRVSLQFFEERRMLILAVDSDTAPALPDLSMTDKVILWKPLLEDLFDRYEKDSEYTVAVGKYPELAGRMIGLALASDQWDRQSGKAAAGDTGEWLTRLLNQSDAIPELNTLFEAFGYKVSVRSAEAVLLCTADSGFNVPPAAHLPCGADLIFSLEQQMEVK
jgi:hypothetical protein